MKNQHVHKYELITDSFKLGGMLLLVGAYCAFGQSCTYVNNSNQVPACGGDSGGPIQIVYANQSAVCMYSDSLGTLGQCNWGASSGGTLCTGASTTCSYTRTYSGNNCIYGMFFTIPPSTISSTVTWPQPSGSCQLLYASR
jgi:hypothetical protein